MVETIGFRHPFITNIVEHRLHVCSSSGDCAEVEVVFWINMSPQSDDPRFLSPVTTVTRQHGRLAERGDEQTTAAKVFFNVYSYYSCCLLQSYIDSIPVKKLKTENKQFKTFFNYPFIIRYFRVENCQLSRVSI